MTKTSSLSKELSVIIIKHRTKPFKSNPGLKEKVISALKEQEFVDYIITPEYSFCKLDDMIDIYTLLKERGGYTTFITGMMYKERKKFLLNEAWILTPNNLFVQTKHNFTNEDRKIAKENKLELKKTINADLIEYPLNKIFYRIMIKSDALKDFPKRRRKPDLLITLGKETYISKNKVSDLPDTEILKNGGYLVKCNRFDHNLVVRKIKNHVIETVNPEKHKKKRIYDLYLLKFDK